MDIRRVFASVPVIGRLMAPLGAPTPSRSSTMAGDRLARSGPQANLSRVLTGFEQLPPATGKYGMGSGETLTVHNAQAKPPQGPGLSMMTFKVYLGGKKRTRGSEEWKRLQDVADTATLSLHAELAGVEATGKRFDNIYAPPGLAPETVEIDRPSKASDHQPVMVQYNWT